LILNNARLHCARHRDFAFGGLAEAAELYRRAFLFPKAPEEVVSAMKLVSSAMNDKTPSWPNTGVCISILVPS
jgi:hypothetical protein